MSVFRFAVKQVLSRRSRTALALHVNVAEAVMAKCDVCGNDYDKSFEVHSRQGTFTFDSFECAIHKLAPHCAHCGCRIIGHGMEASGTMYCCAYCARHSGVTAVADRA